MPGARPPVHPWRGRGLVVVAVMVAFAAAGCDSGGQRRPARPQPSSSGTTTTTSVALTAGGSGRAGCRPATPYDARRNEIRGTTQGGELWGLVFKVPFTDGPIRAGQRMKIVWRMTGHGPLKVSVTDPRGRPARLEWGPEAHSASTFQRPGDEWGTGLRFDRSGCWEIALQRADTRGAVWLRVRA